LIPLRDENPTEITPFMTFIFIAMNIAAWFMLQGAGEPDRLMASVVTLGTVPCQITGACPAEGLTWGTMVTSMFLHGGWGHLLGNMVFLWVFGNNIEDSMGHLRFIAFYLLTGISASAAHVFLNPSSPIPAVGASGAISAVMGAYILLYPRVRVHTFVPPFFFLSLPAVVILGYWFLIQLAMGLVTLTPEAAAEGGVAFWAHIGGFVVGLLLIKLFEKPALTHAKRNKIRLSREEVSRLEW
jgi:membrane associated rhomboid family serine protease